MNSPAMSRSQYPKEKNKTQKCMTKPDESQRADKVQYRRRFYSPVVRINKGVRVTRIPSLKNLAISMADF